MSTRSSSLQATNTLAISREIDSKYDAVIAVRDKLTEIELVAGLDIEQLLTELQNAQDFTGINVVAGETASWNATTKTITVPTVKGDQGVQGPVGIDGLAGATGEKGDRGLTGAAGTNGRDGVNGRDGTDGINGVDGVDGKDLTIEQISYDSGTGRFVWQFSDGTSYETPDLRGAKGDTGSKGDRGDTGISVHHIKGTSTTNVLGDFATYGDIDTYTIYGDAAETINLGYFRVNNGLAKDDQSSIMFGSTYDTNFNGIVDNSERLGGQLPSHYVDVVSTQSVSGNKTFTGNVTVQGDMVVNGNSVVVNAQTVEVEDTLLLINKGEVGSGVTAGEAGILVDRGTAPDYKFVWEEAGQAFKIGEVGSLQKVATREDTPINSGIAVWDAGTSKFNTTLDVKVDSLQLNGGSGTEGTLSWNTTEGTADLELPGGSTLQIGQETVRLVRNSTASTITNGAVCMFAGTIGTSGRIKVKPFTGGFNEAMYVYGVATQDIAAGADGLITIEGKVRGIDTTGSSVGETWIDEDILYAKPGDSGKLTKVVPSVAELRMPMASVIKAHTNGTLEIRFTPINENQFEPRNANIQAHISSTSNPHGVTKAQVGLGNVDNTSDINKPISTATQTALDLKAPIANPTFTGVVSGITKTMVGLGDVDNTADSAKNVLSATKWTTSRLITLGGDATGSVNINGNSDVTLTVSVVDDSHNHAFGNLTGKPTTLAGYGISDATPSSHIGTTGAAHGVATISVNGFMSSTDKIKLDGIASGATNVTNTDQLTNGAGFITSSSSITGNAATATKLTTARTINGVSFDGTTNITITDNTKIPLTGATLSGSLIFNNGTINSNGFSFISNTGATPPQDINVDTINGLLRFFRNNGLTPLGIGIDNNLYADNGTNGNGRILTSTTPIGYVTSALGVGGTVAQGSWKTDTVTLNKLTGLISTANSALAAGASATFTLSNNQIGANDGFYITPYNGYIDPYNYKIETISTFNGGARIKITNISTGSLSDIVQFKFQVVKGVIS